MLAWVLAQKPKLVIEQQLVGPILPVLCSLLGTPQKAEKGEGEGAEEEEEASVHTTAAQVLDAMALALPRKHIFPPMYAFIKNMAANPEATRRQAAFTALAAIIEGTRWGAKP